MKHVISLGTLIVFLLAAACPSPAQQEQGDTTYELEGMEVRATKEDRDVSLSPGSTTLDLEEYEPVGSPSSVLDVLEQSPLIDFRQASDLAPAEDGVQMRGFDSRQFVTALDGLSVQKIGGYWGQHYLDFSGIPLADIDEVEIISGPHSALYPGKAIGGVINLTTRPPKRWDTLKPDAQLSTSYGTYDTRNNFARVDGGNEALSYGISYRDYNTEGYLRNNAADIETVAGRLGLLLPTDGYVRLSGSHTDKLREEPVINEPSRADYDSDYPVVKDEYAPYGPDVGPRREKDISLLRLDAEQPSSWGDWKLGVYRKHEDQVYKCDQVPGGRWKNEEDAETEWLTWQGKLQNDFSLGNHDLTLGVDAARLFMEDDGEDQERERTYAAFAEDEWRILPTLTLKTGLRYDYQTIWWFNENVRTGNRIDPNKGENIEKDYSQLVPKSFLTYELDRWAEALRDTSISLGVSHIWTPREECSV
ncbi:MAG: TonB-dependent receptor [Desulfohalobiaceae bacterium]|nr:TonB-dependent receptor [Desulfohalobiaceae bacterium]